MGLSVQLTTEAPNQSLGTKNLREQGNLPEKNQEMGYQSIQEVCLVIRSNIPLSDGYGK